ncbi:hypothetical protein ACJMK2_029963 [Sinanodonta woodiana]|uniref:LRAT domain-containing protein n=1 Tax=Sinanodonta woodiana TaxID=1069815 RepID=A0ABD3XE82_SINWO
MPRRSCLHCCLKIRVENMRMLKMGQHIIFPGERGLKHITKKGTQKKWYRHHAIIKEVNIRSDFCACLVLIHFWSTNGDKKCGVTETKELYNLITDEIYIRKYKQYRYRPAEVVRRAESKLGNETKYNILTYNCEHLATWCVVGEKESMQVNFCKSIVRQLVILVIYCVLWILKLVNMERVYTITEFMLLLCSSWYLCYRHTYFIERYESQKTICKYCLNLHLLDLWARFVTTYIILIILKFYFHFTDDITSLFIALCFYLIIGNIIKLIRKKHINFYPDVKRKVKKISDIKIGDVISLNYENSNYYIIVTDLISEKRKHKKQTRGKLRGIFYDSPCLFSSGTIQKHYFYLDLTMHNVMYIHSAQFNAFKIHPSDVVVARAQKRIGEKKWNWFSNRSRHFCLWAKFKEDKKYRYNYSRKSQKEPGANSDTKVRSSLLIEIVEARIREDIRKGDIVEIKSFGLFTDSGIVVDIVNSTQDQIFTMDVVLKKGFVRSVVKMVRFNVDLRVNRIWIHRYHPVHCFSREKCIERARKKIDEACGQWTQTRFIRDCIIEPWRPLKQE